MERFSWKVTAALVFGFFALVLVLLLGFGTHRTAPTVDRDPSSGIPENGKATDIDPSGPLSRPHGRDVSPGDKQGEGRPLPAGPGHQVGGGLDVSHGESRQDVEGRPLVWPRGIGPDDLPPWMRGRPEDYLEKIEDVRQETPSRERTPENRIVLFVGSQPDLLTGYPYSDVVFDPSVVRLYAWFSSDTDAFAGRTKVLAKWTHEDSTEVLFEGMGILDSTPYNYIWWENSYWDPGRYSVELYGLEEEIPLLGWGSFEIADLNEHTGFAGLYADPVDLISRQSFYLEEEIYLKVNYSSTQDQQIQILVKRVPDGEIVKGGLVSFPPGMDRDFTVSLTALPYAFGPGTYILELFSYPEPQHITGRNIFHILE